jgi:hypothetical protein
MSMDSRWQQRFSNYRRALLKLQESSHTYDAGTADSLVRTITGCYVDLFTRFAERMGAVGER